MSEYQYYEFRAVDRPLENRAMAALRRISSRAEITPSGLWNEYHYGSFRGNPDRLMAKYFDAFVYVANWGTRRLMLRVPRNLHEMRSVKSYCTPDAVEARHTKNHLILDFQSQSEDYGYEEAEGWIDDLLPLRKELLAGDTRCLYLAWLSAVDGGHVDDDASEPSVPAGLRSLSAPLKALVEFLRIDPALIRVAAKASEVSNAAVPAQGLFVRWVKSLSAAEKDRLLLRSLTDDAPAIRGELQSRYLIEHRRLTKGRKAASQSRAQRRTAGELLQAREALAQGKRRTEVLAEK